MNRRSALKRIGATASLIPFAGCSGVADKIKNQNGPNQPNRDSTPEPVNVTVFNRSNGKLETDIEVSAGPNDKSVYEKQLELESGENIDLPIEIEPKEYTFRIEDGSGSVEEYVWTAQPEHGLDIMVYLDKVEFEQWTN